MEKEGRENNCQGLVGMTQVSWALEKVWLPSSLLLYLTWSQANGLLVPAPDESIQPNPFTMEYCHGFSPCTQLSVYNLGEEKQFYLHFFLPGKTAVEMRAAMLSLFFRSCS